MKSTKKCIFVIGPESSGTRIFTDILSTCPEITGTDAAQQHQDLLDEVWDQMQFGSKRKAKQSFTSLNPKQHIITRRSFPHGRPGSRPAKFRVYPHLKQMVKLVRKAGYTPVFLITTRSAPANIESWTRNRASASSSIENAYRQYREAYAHIIIQAHKQRVDYLLLSLEALHTTPSTYLDGILALIGVKGSCSIDSLQASSNTARHEQLLNRLKATSERGQET